MYLLFLLRNASRVLLAPAKIPLIICLISNPCHTEASYVTQHKLSGADLNILRDKAGKNTVVSAFAFRLPLCKLANAASTATRHEIISVLDIQTISQTKTCYSSLFPTIGYLFETDLTSVNKIYVNYTDDIDDRFIQNSTAFGLTVSKIGFKYRAEAVSYVNEEFSSKTYMRVRDVLELKDININSSILLVNGFHYKATWEIPFTSNKVQNNFYYMNGRQLDMMQTVTQCSFLDVSEARFKAISLHLSQTGTYVTFILPYKNSNITQLLDYMSQCPPNFLESVEKSMQWKFVNVAIPKFKIKTGINWTPYLKEIGLNQMTDKNNTGLNTILKYGVNARNNMYVSAAKQKIFFEIDEGTKSDMPPLFQEPRVIPEVARERPQSPPIKLEHFTVDKPVFFSIAMTVGNSRQDSKIYRLLNGIYYGPE